MLLTVLLWVLKYTYTSTGPKKSLQERPQKEVMLWVVTDPTEAEICRTDLEIFWTISLGE